MNENRELALALVGCDFRIAPTAWRSVLVLEPELRAGLFRALEEAAGAAGFAAVDTCNRTEWVVEARRPEWAAGLLRSWMHRLWSERFPGEPLPEPHVRLRTEAARHLLRVAVGLESVVPGEREIAQQVRRAFETARAEGTTSLLLNELAQTAARTVRRVERRCDFRDATRGVHALALERVMGHGRALDRHPRVGVVGRGHVGRRVCTLLERAGHAPAALFNRTPAPDTSPAWQPLETVVSTAAELDALVVASGAPRPVVDCAALAAGRTEPLLVVDIGVPAQVEGAASADLVRVVALDELIEEQGPHSAPREVFEAEAEVEAGVSDLLLAMRKGAAGPILRYIQQSRDQLGMEGLPALLDEVLADLPNARRRKLESALRGLLLERDRELLDRLARLLLSMDEAIS